MTWHPHRHPRPARSARPLITLAALLALVAGPTLVAAPASAANPPTPGHFTGYGFDQCVAPTQRAMNAWLRASPFWAVGIYISGKSRGCRSQPNLTPSWVRTQLANGWRLLPITLGPQASCNPRFPRYGNDPTVSPRSADNYAKARRQGRAAANAAVSTAKRLGIVPRSTLWYDMEAYDISKVACRESALAFTHAWTRRLHALNYVSGVYSSAAAHIKALDDVRVHRRGRWALPDRIWIARWDGKANTSTSYIRDDGWRPGGRMKQYRGDHNETHGGVTINIDSNFLDLGRGSKAKPAPRRCGGVRMNYFTYPTLRVGSTKPQVEALQCLLKQHGHYGGEVTGKMDGPTQNAVRRYRVAKGFGSSPVAGERVWASLHVIGSKPLIKYGAASEAVRRLQRALNVRPAEQLGMNGTFGPKLTAAVKRFQGRHGLPRNGVVTAKVWKRFANGRY